MFSKLKIALSTLVAGAAVAALTAFATPAPAPALAAANAAPAAQAAMPAAAAPAPAAMVKKASNSTADHSKFKELQKTFKTAPEVTKACLTCHTEAAKQIHKTKHWTWEYHQPGDQAEAGQKTRHQQLLYRRGIEPEILHRLPRRLRLEERQVRLHCGRKRRLRGVPRIHRHLPESAGIGGASYL